MVRFVRLGVPACRITSPRAAAAAPRPFPATPVHASRRDLLAAECRAAGVAEWARLLQRIKCSVTITPQFKKPVLRDLPVLDVRALSPQQLGQLSGLYDQVAMQEMDRLRNMENDPLRTTIDTGLAHVLGIPEPTVIRQLLSQEPVVSNAPLGPKPTAAEEADAQLHFELL